MHLLTLDKLVENQYVQRPVSEESKSNLGQNIASLYGVHIFNYIFPLITIPYLARVLGPFTWGVIAFTQAFGQYLNLFIEYGFGLSATREIARHRDNREKLSQLLSSVMGAKILLASVAVGAAISVRHWIPILRDYPFLFWSGLFYAIAQSLNPLWFFQGLERMKTTATLDIFAKALATGSIFVFIHSQNDAWLVLVLQGFAALISTLIALKIAYKHAPFTLPKGSSIYQALKLGWSMFLYRSSLSLYSISNTIILGFLTPPQVVGYFAGADKITRALLGLMQPISQTLYPRINYLIQQSSKQANRLIRISLFSTSTLGLMMGLVSFLFAPYWIRLILGTGYEPAIPVLRILSLLLPMISVSIVLGIQWMLPLGLDKPFNRIMILAGLLNIALASFMAPHFASIGMAWAVVCTETFVTATMFIIFLREEQIIAPSPLEAR